MRLGCQLSAGDRRDDQATNSCSFCAPSFAANGQAARQESGADQARRDARLPNSGKHSFPACPSSSLSESSSVPVGLRPASTFPGAGMRDAGVIVDKTDRTNRTGGHTAATEVRTLLTRP
jgi:hypothetical protein